MAADIKGGANCGAAPMVAIGAGTTVVGMGCMNAVGMGCNDVVGICCWTLKAGPAVGCEV